MKNFILSLQFIFKPSYWDMLYPYNEHWDKKLNELLDKYDFTEINNHTAKLGDNLIWIGNQKYACMELYNGYIDRRFRASRLTIQRGLKKLNKAIEDRDNKKMKLEIDYINKIK